METFSIITTTATTRGAWIHDRFPVVLQQEDWLRWLAPTITPADLGDLVAKVQTGPVAESMEERPVTRKMNNAKYEAPEAIEALPDVTRTSTETS